MSAQAKCRPIASSSPAEAMSCTASAKMLRASSFIGSNLHQGYDSPTEARVSTQKSQRRAGKSAARLWLKKISKNSITRPSNALLCNALHGPHERRRPHYKDNLRQQSTGTPYQAARQLCTTHPRYIYA